MDVAVERLEMEEERRHDSRKYCHELFKVYIGEEKGILTIFTLSDSKLVKWLAEVKKTYRKKKEPLVVGFCYEHQNANWWGGYEVLSLYIGSQCLIYQLPEGPSEYSNYSYKDIPQVFRDFLTDSNVIFVGMDIDAVAKKLEKNLELKIGKKVDIRSLAYKLYEKVRDAPDVKNMSLNEMTMKLVDKRMDVVRKRIDDYWRDPVNREFEINRDYAMYLTVDAFFCHEIGVKYFDLVTKLSGK